MTVMAQRAGIVKLADDASGYFPDNSHIMRRNVPWSPFNLVGSEAGPIFKLLAVMWHYDMFTMLLNVPGGMKVEPHYHIGEAHGYIMTGGFDYEYGNVFAGDYIGEGLEIEHSANIGPEDVLQVSVIFGGLCGVKPGGGPDLSTLVGCRAVYEMAKKNNAADHIAPPPPGWRSKWEIN